MRYKNQKVAVLGAGLSGAAAATLLKDEGAQVTVLDSADEKKLLHSTLAGLREKGVNIVTGEAADTDATAYDFAVISPGIDPESALARNFFARGIDIIGELELGWRSCDLPVIAVTGTNGKTTTTELLSQMLNGCGQRTIACGNIGKPLSDIARRRSEFDVLTVEVSSFQLETIKSFHPGIAIWLNFAPDHLDRYASVAEYRTAKLRVFENQTPDDVAIVNSAEDLGTLHARKVTFSAYDDAADFRLTEGVIVHRDKPVLRLSETKLRGSHNIENLMATLAAGHARGLSFEEMVPPLTRYQPQPHRCEFVRTVDGVDYVNDSKATNLDALEAALVAQTKPIVLIAGGKDKGFTFETLRTIVQERVKSIVLMGEMAERIAQDWKGAANAEIATSLADAVDRAHAAAGTGDVVLFSPGTSSFDMFKSYVDRGDQFRALVHALPKTK
ncbi:MAG TPA: UDP-N-acetylmuramoyl-L-alanine--D-glutamate ligase [Chthoniobacterales bacterium]|nr:UDP-N-acetylmuramoyl-L-alanine--D-glutamate ligase [Chthoniobacterales bacterium]